MQTSDRVLTHLTRTSVIGIFQKIFGMRAELHDSYILFGRFLHQNGLIVLLRETQGCRWNNRYKNMYQYCQKNSCFASNGLGMRGFLTEAGRENYEQAATRCSYTTVRLTRIRNPSLLAFSNKHDDPSSSYIRRGFCLQRSLGQCSRWASGKS